MVMAVAMAAIPGPGQPSIDQDEGIAQGDCANIVRFIEQRSLQRARSLSTLVSQDATTTTTSNVSSGITPVATSTESATMILPTMSHDQQKLIQELDADLKLSARVGVALLGDKQVLEAQLKEWEDIFMRQKQKQEPHEGKSEVEDATLRPLVGSEGIEDVHNDPIWSSKVQGLLKDKAQLQHRLEITQTHLDQSESQNRTLQSQLEGSRRTISRLTSDSLKLLNLTSQHAALTRTCDDFSHELTLERKRANGLETKYRKMKDHLSELEERLIKANGDLSEMRQDKVLRSRKSHEALAEARSRMSNHQHRRQLVDIPGGGDERVPPVPALPGSAVTGSIHENVEAQELLKLMETLVSENELLRSESLDLREMLEGVRDEQVQRQQDSLNGSDGTGVDLTEDEERFQPKSALSAASPSLPLEPPSVSSPPTLATFVSMPSRDADDSNHVHASNRPIGSRVIPFGRPYSRRTFSVDVVGSGICFARTERGRPESAPVTPHFDMIRSSNAPPRPHDTPLVFDANAFAGVNTDGEFVHATPVWRPKNAEGNASQDRRTSRPRPLSLSLGPSLFPQSVPEDEGLSPSGSSMLSSSVGHYPRRYRIASQSRSPRPAAIPQQRTFSSPPIHYSPTFQCTSIDASSFSRNASTDVKPSGISLSSPEKKRIASNSSETNRTPAVLTVDSSTQTSPENSSVPPRDSVRRIMGLGRGNISCISSNLEPSLISDESTPTAVSEDSTSFDSRQRIVLENDALAGDSSILLHTAQAGRGFGLDSRTAALGTLIEHATKLLHRLQTADVGNQEKRLKKHNLVGGDVKHLSQANLREVVADVERLRPSFKRVLEHERSHAAKEGTSALSEIVSESLVTRRDFVALVKLLRDLLFEISRLRSLVNRVELDPALATTLLESDVPDTIDLADKSLKQSTGLLAPITRFLVSVVSNEQEDAPTAKATTLNSARPLAKRGGSSAVSSAAVNVEFESGAIRHHAIASNTSTRPNVASSQPQPSLTVGETVSRKNGAQVKRDLSNIFAGGIVPPGRPERLTTTPFNPFGRILAYARPSMSTTTNAVIDSIPHAPQPSSVYQPTLLERQLRPRGYSDSSIRSTYLQHANPHHKIISPAPLALSSDSGNQNKSIAAIPIKSSIEQPDTAHLSKQLSALSASVSRKPSVANLRARASRAQLRSVSTPAINDENIPPVPILPISITSSSAKHPQMSTGAAPSSVTGSQIASTTFVQGAGGANNSLFGSLWAHTSAVVRPNLNMANEDRSSDRNSSFQAKNQHWPSHLVDRVGKDFG